MLHLAALGGDGPLGPLLRLEVVEIDGDCVIGASPFLGLLSTVPTIQVWFWIFITRGIT